MKFGQEKRQVLALERTLRSIEMYKDQLSKLDTKYDKENRTFIEDKIAKAETCVENLKAKGITLKKDRPESKSS